MKFVFKFTVAGLILLAGFLLSENQTVFGGTSVVLDSRPDLYILSVGIDEYQSKEFNMKYAKRKMKKRSRIILTSGDKPVLDAWKKEDGSVSGNSPFADAFLRALKTNGGDDKVLITGEIIPFIDKLTVEPQKGKLSGSDGDFVFVRPLEKE